MRGVPREKRALEVGRSGHQEQLLLQSDLRAYLVGFVTKQTEQAHCLSRDGLRKGVGGGREGGSYRLFGDGRKGCHHF